MAATPRRRWGRAALAVLLTAIAIASIVVWRDRDRSPLDRARQLLARDDGFDTGLESGGTFARVAQHLERAVDDCRNDERGTSCQALSAALGYGQVLAALVLDCESPGRFEARERMASYLEAVATVAPDAERVPSPPRLPSCG